MMPIRTLSSTDAEVMARTVETRTAVKGCIECHGLTWRSDALLEWENRQREKGDDPKVEVRIDELDLHVVYVDVPERGVGPFKAQSRQPEFTRGLSLFELRRLKRAIKDKELSDRLGRMKDTEAMRLRVEFHALLGHGDDPAAQKRLTDLQDQMAQLRLQQARIEAPSEPNSQSNDDSKPAGKPKRTSSRKSASPTGSAPNAAPTVELPPLVSRATTPKAKKPADFTQPSCTSNVLPPRRLTSIKINRRLP